MMQETLLEQIEIQAEGLLLRPLRKSDMGRIDLYASDVALARMTSSIPHPLPPGATEAFIARTQAPDRVADVWAIDGQGEGAEELVGVISLDRVAVDQTEIGFWVAPPYWNTGIASKAVRALIKANPLHSKVMFANTFQDNAASARVLTNCGFDYLGDAEIFCVARNAAVPSWTYSLKLN